jgi:hypothetical protein
VKKGGGGGMDQIIEHHLVQVTAPELRLETRVESVCLHGTFDATSKRGVIRIDERHADGVVFDLGLRPELGEKALITAVELQHATNDTGRNVQFALNLRLGGCASPLYAANPDHPDACGTVRFVVPKHADGPVAKVDRVLYEPNFFNLGFDVLGYVGREEQMLAAPRSVAVGPPGTEEPDFEVFAVSDPLPCFVLTNKHLFPDVVGYRDIVRVKTVYRISKTVCAVVRSFFRDTVFPLLRYTSDNTLQLTWRADMDPAPDLPDHLMTPAELKREARKNDGFAMLQLFLVVRYVVVSAKRMLPPFRRSELELE